MFCKNCGKPMNDNQAICLNCGVKTGVGEGYCANCGNAVAPGAEVCMSCGVAIKKGGSNDDYKGMGKIGIALICFFFGGIGIHNFILGETKKGIFKIIASFCLFGIGSIFALIDFIKILVDKYEINPDKLI